MFQPNSYCKEAYMASTQKAAQPRRSGYRWVVLSTIFVGYVICMADRSNIGAVLPMMRSEFQISNFEAGAVSSLFFLGYAVSQIPAGLVMGKFGTRKIVSVAILGFSIVTFLMGHVGGALALLVLRLFLGLIEGPHARWHDINNQFMIPSERKGHRDRCLHRLYHGGPDSCPNSFCVPGSSIWLEIRIYLVLCPRIHHGLGILSGRPFSPQGEQARQQG